MQSNKKSYSDTVSSDPEKGVHPNIPYGPGTQKKDQDNHDAFIGSDYPSRKMTFGKIKYVQK